MQRPRAQQRQQHVRLAPSLVPPRARCLQKVDALNAARSTLAADAAGAAAQLKALVVRAEDARLLGDMAAMRRAYRQLYDLNRWGLKPKGAE